MANAVYDGTDAVMLSGETSVGAHPLAAVQTMERVVRAAELHAMSDEFVRIRRGSEKLTDEDNICRSACIMAQEAGARAMIAITKSGKTARLLSKIPFRCPDPRLFTVSADNQGTKPGMGSTGRAA